MMFSMLQSFYKRFWRGSFEQVNSEITEYAENKSNRGPNG